MLNKKIRVGIFLSDEKLKIVKKKKKTKTPMFQQKKKENKTYCVVVGALTLAKLYNKVIPGSKF